MKKILSNIGSTVLEIVIAVGFFATISSGIVVLYLGAYRTSVDDLKKLQADMYLQEGFEAVRAIRDYNFNDLADGTHGLTNINGYWEFSGTSDPQGGFVRSITISDLKRSASCAIDGSGTTDSYSKKIDVNITWTGYGGLARSLSASEYLNRWSSPCGCGQASCLEIGTSSAVLTSGDLSLEGLFLKNNGNTSISVDKIKLTWTNSNFLNEIVINEVPVWNPVDTGSPSGQQSSDTEIDIDNVDLSSLSGEIPITRFLFDAPMTGADFTMLVTMSDGTTRYVSFTPTSSPVDNLPPAAISDLTVSNPTQSTADLRWTAPGDDMNIGIATSYDIRYSTSAINDGNWASATQVSGEPVPLIAGTSQSMTVMGLLPSTLYYFAIKTSDEVPNISALSNVVSVTTLTAPQGNYLYVDITAMGLDFPNNKQINNIQLRNIGSVSITIDKMIVAWVGGDNKNYLKRISMNGGVVYEHDAESGTTVDINNTTISSGQTMPLDYILFGRKIEDATVTLTFIMTDASTKTVTFTTPEHD